MRDTIKCKNLPYFCPLIFEFYFPEIATPSARNDSGGELPLSYEFLYHVLQFSLELANLVQIINE